jgi:choline kinase
MLSLAVALREFPAGCAMVKLDGDVVFKRGLVSGLTRAGVPCAVAVERGHTLGAEEMKVELENGRIARFGKGIDPARAHGESIGIEWIGAHGVEPVRLALERAVRDGRTNLYYEDVYNDLLPGLEMHAVTVASSEWTEVDDLPDLERARALVKAWDA